MALDASVGLADGLFSHHRPRQHGERLTLQPEG